VGGLGEKVGQISSVDPLLANAARGQQFLAAGLELARQPGQEGARFWGKDFCFQFVPEGRSRSHFQYPNGFPRLPGNH